MPGLGRSPRGWKGYLLQYSGLENSMAYIVHGVGKSWTQPSDFDFHEVGGGWCTAGGRRGGSGKGMSKVIQVPANIKLKIKTKLLKFRVLKSPLRHFKLFPLYNLRGFGDSSQRQVTLKHNTELEREEFWGLKRRKHMNRMAAWPTKRGEKLEDAKRKLPSSPPSLLTVVGSVCSHSAEFTYSWLLPCICN